MGIFEPFYTDVTGRLRRGNRNISVEARRSGVSSVMIAFFLPDSPDVQQQVIRAFNTTYKDVRATPEYYEYEEARIKLDNSRKRTLDALNTAIETTVRR